MPDGLWHLMCEQPVKETACNEESAVWATDAIQLQIQLFPCAAGATLALTGYQHRELSLTGLFTCQQCLFFWGKRKRSWAYLHGGERGCTQIDSQKMQCALVFWRLPVDSTNSVTQSHLAQRGLGYLKWKTVAYRWLGYFNPRSFVYFKFVGVGCRGVNNSAFLMSLNDRTPDSFIINTNISFIIFLLRKMTMSSVKTDSRWKTFTHISLPLHLLCFFSLLNHTK